MDKILTDIANCKDLIPLEKDTITKFIKRYQKEPYRSKVCFNSNATDLSQLFRFDLTLEGSAFWNEVVKTLSKNKPKGQTKLDL